MKVNITIPVLNRESTIGPAIESALRQSYRNTSITVVDDGSTDGTWEVIKSFEKEENFSAIKLESNVGTAQAKNVSILLSDYDAITFHDSDDIALEHKILLQARALQMKGHKADEILNWASIGHRAGEDLQIDVAVGAYKLIKMDGSVHHIRKRVSLVDDFFPNLQFPSQTEGDWCLINAGLFRRRVFSELGGYLDSVEEDREIRNRTIAFGSVYYFIEEPLLDKIEMNDSLTVKDDTNYIAKKRLVDRTEVWRRNDFYRMGQWGKKIKEFAQVKIDLNSCGIEEFVNEKLLTVNRDIPATEDTLKLFEQKLEPEMDYLGVPQAWSHI